MAIKETKNGFRLTGKDANEYVRQLGVKFEPARCKAPGCRHSAMEGCFREDCPATVECSRPPQEAEPK